MRITADGTLQLSPSDLANHLACPHLTQLAAQLQRQEIPPPPERENAHADLIARKGDEHEAAFLAALLEQGREVVEIGFGDDGLEAAARRRRGRPGRRPRRPRGAPPPCRAAGAGSPTS